MASSPVATAAQAVEQDAAAQPAAQASSAGSKVAQTNTIQDTVTLSNGIPRQTTAEEAGLFQVTAPTLNSAPAREGLNPSDRNTGNPAAPKANAANATTPAITNAQAPAAAAANPAASAAGAQTAATPTSQSQNLLNQFTQYLQQLGLSPQAMNQMLQAAEILNNLDPPAMQQAIGELRAQAATLAAQATGAPLPTAPTVRAGVSSSAAGTSAQPSAASAASGSTPK